MAHGLGRRQASDNRDQRHLLRAALPAGLTRPASKHWRLWWHGDQLDTPHCVGFAWHGLLRALPMLQRYPKPDTLYLAAQHYDEWPGEDYDGTSVRGGAKALQQQFHELQIYGWEFTLDGALDWMGFHGPCVFGINWYDRMFTPDPTTGLVHVGGSLAGGHAIVCLGYDQSSESLLFQNSWGLSWGLHGRFRLGFADAVRLLSEEGEVCSPTEMLL